MREALFSILGPDLDGLGVLELYAGSGALGFEALSRGASAVTFVEADHEVCGILGRNASDLGVERRCRILCGEVEKVLEGAQPPPGGPFGLVLADPPYDAMPGEGLLQALGRPGWLDPAARVVFQRDRRSPAVAPASRGGPALVRTARYARNCLDFYSFSGKSAE